MLLEREDGQAMVEFALILPILFLLLSGILDFGWIFGNHLLASNAGREAARYTAIHYYDSKTDDDRAIAEGIVTNIAPSLDNVTVGLQQTGDMVTVTIQSDIPVLTPFISVVLGDTYRVKAKTSMRLE